MNTTNFASRKFLFLSIILLLALSCGLPPSPAFEDIPVVESTPTMISPTPMLQFEAATANIISTSTETAMPPTQTISTPLSTGIAIRDVTYCTMGGIPLKMDIFFPFLGNGPWPVVIYVHGGGWISGSKLDRFGDVDVPALREAGYITIAVSYRLAPRFPFPTMIQDVKCAVRYLRAHVGEYNLDPNRIGVRGASAGGHIVALLGTADESAGWDVGEYLEYSSRVQTVVEMFGPTDLTDESVKRLMRNMAPSLFGTENIEESMLVLASPVTYVGPGDAPTMIMHGDQDLLVDVKQAELFFNALITAGVPAELVIVKNSDHAFEPVEGDFTIPTRSQITELMIAFFDQYLKP